MTLHFTRLGSGKPLLLVHGLGGSRRSWEPILRSLAQTREVIAIDLPGHGHTPAHTDSGSFLGLTRSLDEWLTKEGLTGVDMVGSSMGARLVLEMARLGQSGAVVALNPGGFWRGWERTFFRTTISASIRLVRAAKPALPMVAGTAAGRTLLMAQLSAAPWKLEANLVSNELKSFAETATFNALVRDLATGPMQQGIEDPRRSVTIGWGRKDRLCLPRQAARAVQAFPTAELRWLDRSGHFPMWDQPHDTTKLILRRCPG